MVVDQQRGIPSNLQISNTSNFPNEEWMRVKLNHTNHCVFLADVFPYTGPKTNTWTIGASVVLQGKLQQRLGAS